MLRNLPWRKTHDPYKILVSEIMLQQTQVERVVPFYNAFIKKFPNAKTLAKAKLPQVLKLWQGLGYNRRAKFLHEAAKLLCSADILREAEVPRAGVGVVFISPKRGTSAKQLSTEFLETLPGVGPYTARAIAAFAYNRPEVFIETNIRTVFLHHFFQGKTNISDHELLPLIEQTLKKSKIPPRDFYAALMDYGSELKQSGLRINNKSKHYVKQKKFEGSTRQLRGAIVRELLKKPATLAQLTKNLARKKGEVERELSRLVAEKLLSQTSRRTYTVGP